MQTKLAADAVWRTKRQHSFFIYMYHLFEFTPKRRKHGPNRSIAYI